MSIERTNKFISLLFPSISLISALNLINIKVKQSRDTHSLDYTINVFFLVASILLFLGIYFKVLRDFSLWRNNFGYIIVGFTIAFFLYTIYNIYNYIREVFTPNNKDLVLHSLTLTLCVMFCVWIVHNKYNKDKVDVFNDLIVATDLRNSISSEKEEKGEENEKKPEKTEINEEEPEEINEEE